MKEQYQRFEDTINRVSGGVFECELCPIYEECIATHGSDNSCCEEVLFHYIMTGDRPQAQ